MSEYKRLTRKNRAGYYVPFAENTCTGSVCYTRITRGRIVDRLAELEDEIESGRRLKLPCKLGDTVFFYDFSEKEIMQGKVIGIRLNYYTPNNPIWIRVQYDIPMVKSDCDTEIWASMVFTDKSEAEARLAELKGEKHE